jgi:hypothetical protein
MKNSTGSELPRLFIDTRAWLVLTDDHDPAYAEVASVRRHYLEARQSWIVSS